MAYYSTMADEPSTPKVAIEPKSPWLAITFGCCASGKNDDDEDEGRKALRAGGESEMTICYDQPRAIPLPRAEPSASARPPTSHSLNRHVSQWASNTKSLATRASSRASSIHTLTLPRRSHSKPVPRPSIGRPTDVRHYDGLDGVDGIQSMLDDAPLPVRRRRSFQPLELSIYLPDGRLSPLPDFSSEGDFGVEAPKQALVRERDSRTNSVCSNPSTASYLIARKPVGSGLGSRRSSVQSQRSCSTASRPLSGTLSTLPYLLEEGSLGTNSSSDPIVEKGQTSPTPQHLHRSNTHAVLSSSRSVLSRLPSPSPSRGRSSTTPSRPGSRTGNNSMSSRPGSLRRVATRTDLDVDDAIRELNTIVEERRAEAYQRSTTASPTPLPMRPPLSPSHHVPAIAPSLRMHVRSETLSDIGSAFSAPHTGKALPPAPPSSQGLGQGSGSLSLSRKTTQLSLLSPPERAFSGPLDSNPITPPTPTTPMGRLGAWIKRSLPATPSSAASFFRTAPSSPRTQTGSSTASSFYQLDPMSASAGQQSQQPGDERSFSTTPTQQQYQQRPRTPSTPSSSRTVHTRQMSNSTTLLASSPSTPSLTPTSTTFTAQTTSRPTTPATTPRTNLLKGSGKPRRVPAPLTLAKEKEMQVEAALGSGVSIASYSSGRSGAKRLQELKPPASPNYGVLRGMEITAKEERGRSSLGGGVGVARGSGGFAGGAVQSPVGVAF